MPKWNKRTATAGPQTSPGPKAQGRPRLPAKYQLQIPTYQADTDEGVQGVIAKKGTATTNMYVQTLPSWLDKDRYAVGIQPFVLDGDKNKYIVQQKVWSLRVHTPKHVRRPPPSPRAKYHARSPACRARLTPSRVRRRPVGQEDPRVHAQPARRRQRHLGHVARGD